MGRPYPGGQGVPAVYQKHFGGYKSAVLAIAGERTEPEGPGVTCGWSTTFIPISRVSAHACI